MAPTGVEEERDPMTAVGRSGSEAQDAGPTDANAPEDAQDLETLIPLIAETRGVSLEADPAALNEVRTFLQSHEAETSKTATHVVLESYPDWWVRKRRAPPGLVIQGADDIEELNRHLGYMHSLGIPLTLAERRTPAFRFFQDLEAWGSREAAPAADQLISPDSSLARLIGTVVGEVFPSHGGFLDVAVYNATGLSQTKGVRKMSLRLVWPGVLVDGDRALRVRDLLVARLVAATAEGGALAELEETLKSANPANAWHAVVGDAAYVARAVVRMPLCDRVAPLPLRGPERRPFNPVGVMRFTYCSEGKMKIEWLCEQADLEPKEWAKIGCLRKESEGSGELQLTEWRMPAWQGPQPPIMPSSARPGRIKVRTTAGSDGPGCGGGLRLRARNQATFERAGTLQVVERSFSSTAEEFAGKMEQQLGKASTDPDGGKVWKQPTSDARIIMYAEDKIVKVIGRPNQVRSLVVIIAPHTEAPKKYSLNNLTATNGNGYHAHGTVTADAPATNGSHCNGAHKDSSRPPPSAAFAPKAAVDKEGEKDGEPLPAEKAPPEGQLYVASQSFEAVGQGELGLSIGDVVKIELDPQVGTDQDRWVYGSKEEDKEQGWLPLSHLVPVTTGH